MAVEEQEDLETQANIASGKTEIPGETQKVAEQTSNTIELSPEAQKIQEAIRKHGLEDCVTVDNSKTTVKTSEGDLTFAFSHREWGQNSNDANSPYTKEQLEALIEVFGNKPKPYLEILGLKNTRVDKKKLNDRNFYWSSSRSNDIFDYVWGLDLNKDEVRIGFNCLGEFSELSVQNKKALL